MKLKRDQRTILRSLYKAKEGLDAFTFYRRYGFDAAYLIQITRKLINTKLITLHSTTFRITEKGKVTVEAQSIALLEDENDKPWLLIPEEFKSNRIEPWQPYIPSIKRLDKNFGRDPELSS